MTTQTGTAENAADTAASGAAAPAAAAAPLDATAVAAWLQQNPHFFQDHADLLMQLSIPHESGRAISLLERQVAVFRERQHSLEDQIHEFIDNARNNDSLFEKTRAVLLDVLRCRTLPALLDLVAARLPAEFEAQAAALVFVADQIPSTDIDIRQLPTSAVRSALSEVFTRQRTYCGTLNGAQQALLFPGHVPAIVSAAVVALHLPEESLLRQRCGLPLLLIGSTGDKQFDTSLDTLFLDFIGEVLAVHLQNLVAPA